MTHDVDEALLLADRVLVLDEGRVAHQWALPTARGSRRNDPQMASVRTQVLDALGVDTRQSTHTTRSGAA